MAMITKKYEIENLKIIENGNKTIPEILACRISEGAFEFVIIHWYRIMKQWYDEAGFFYKTPQCEEWRLIPIASWMNKYKTKEDFLIDYPNLIDLFNLIS